MFYNKRAQSSCRICKPTIQGKYEIGKTDWSGIKLWSTISDPQPSSQCFTVPRDSSQKLHFPLKNGGVLKFRTEQADRCDLRASGKPLDNQTQCQGDFSRCMLTSVYKIPNLVVQNAIPPL